MNDRSVSINVMVSRTTTMFGHPLENGAACIVTPNFRIPSPMLTTLPHGEALKMLAYNFVCGLDHV